MTAFAAEINAEEQAGIGPWINTTRSGFPVYTVSAHQPTVTVRLEQHRNDRALVAAFSAVPLPTDAQPPAGADGSLMVWQPSTDRLWEFYRLVHRDGRWYALWGGAMRHVSTNAGVYGPRAWPGAKTSWGISASGLSLLGGLISLEDLELGQINHALEMALPERAAGVVSYPARRSDGTSSNPLALPEGAHLRLNPAANLSALHLPKLTLMLAEAAQRYGIFITDGTGTSGVATFFAQEPLPTGTNPYTGTEGFFEGQSPSQLLASFPWSQLQLLQMNLHHHVHRS